MSRRPDLFIVGAPKSGTTSLYMYLVEHPEVFMSPVKEPMYFSPDFNRFGRSRYEFGRDEEHYLALFDGATTEKRLGEASTHYMASEMAPTLIRAFQPEARIVCIVRNPIDVAYAWHGERVFRGVERSRIFDLELLGSGAGTPYLEVGRYGSQLRRWFADFGRDRIHVIVFDDFVADTAAAFKHLLRFLDVDPQFRPLSFAAHNERAGKSRLVPWLRTRPARLASDTVRTFAGGSVARRLSRWVRNIPVVNRSNPRRPMPEEARGRLKEAYGDEIALAGELIGRDLPALWLPPGR